ncbi:MAG: outer membrane protein assembly factor BamD [Phycisphaerae bacterium]|nr:outer membrane protein assembly factor BamD [Phycisphaerae bacterium]
MTHCTHSASVVAAVLAALSASVLAQGGSEFRGGQWQQVVTPAEGSPEGELALVRWHVDQGDYRKAVGAAKRFLKLYDSPLREEVMLLVGEAEMKRGMLFQGYEWFEKQLAEFPSGRFSSRALEHEFEVAEGFLAGRKRVVLAVFRLPARDDGLEILSRIAEHAPGTDMAQRALLRIAEYHFERGEWMDAAEAYDRYVAAFPRGGKLAEAMLKAAQATYKSFGGIRRDEVPLIEAEQRYREFARRFPISATEAGVEATLEQIRGIRAAKLLEEARFYERVGKWSAATYTYRLVVENYPHTDAAEQAELGLVGLGGGLPAPRTTQPQTAPAPPPPALPAPAPKAPPAAPPKVPPAPRVVVTTQPSTAPAYLEPIDLEWRPATTAPAGERP